jgi:ectoine hydroxylase-related dioxygenase (phytanoyl-CoA dioxygenase family)
MTPQTAHELREHFDTHGFVIIPNAVEMPAIASILADIETLLEEALAGVGQKPPPGATIDDKYSLLKRAAPKLKSHVYDLMTYLDSVHLAARTGALIERIRMLCDGPFLVDGVQVRIDDTSNDRLLPLHQEVYGQISWDCLNAWVPFVAVTRDNGALRLARGSHRAGHLPHCFHPEFNNAHGIHAGQIEERDIVAPSMSAGDAVVFHPLLVHGSGPNRGGTTRWTLVARYNPIRRIPYLENADNPLHIQQKDSAS